MKPYVEIIPIFHFEVEEGYTVSFIENEFGNEVFDIAKGCIKKASIDIFIEYLEKEYGYNESNVIQVYGNNIKFELYLGDEKLTVNGYIFYDKDVDYFGWDSVYVRNGQYKVYNNDDLNGKKAFSIE